MDLPYVDAIRVKGRVYHYYRRDKLRQRIPGQPGSPEFLAAYGRLHAAAQAAEEREKASKPGEGTLRALVAAYRASPDWREKKPSTQVDYEKALVPLETRFGEAMVATLPRAFVNRLRDTYAQKSDGTPTPRTANRMVTVLSILFSFSIENGWRADNPALRPKRLKTGEGYRAWTDAELDQVLESENTSSAVRLAILLAVGTGQRGQDLIAMQWSAFDGTAVQVCQAKTTARLWVPLHRRAREALAAAERGQGTILTRPDGKPWKLDHYRHAMGDAIRSAGVSGVVPHGLRATAARWMAEAGCSEREIMAITGHTTSNMVSRYVREAEQKVRAKGAAAKVERHQKNTSRTQNAKPVPTDC